MKVATVNPITISVISEWLIKDTFSPHLFNWSLTLSGNCTQTATLCTIIILTFFTLPRNYHRNCKIKHNRFAQFCTTWSLLLLKRRESELIVRRQECVLAITTNGDGDLFVCRVSFLAKGRKCNQSNTNWPFNRNKSLADDQTESRAGEWLASLPFLPLFARPPSCTSAVKRDGN